MVACENRTALGSGADVGPIEHIGKGAHRITTELKLRNEHLNVDAGDRPDGQRGYSDRRRNPQYLRTLPSSMTVKPATRNAAKIINMIAGSNR